MSTSPAATLTPCPDPTTLEKLLRDDLSADEAGRVEEHVGACPACQRVLERLVGSLPDTLVPSAGPPGQAADEEPPRLPGYAPLGRIDAGGMGVVWRARDLQFRRTLAVKVMKSWASADPELVRLAERCLAPQKADRPADAGEVAAAVSAYLAGVQERLQEERLRREREQVLRAEEQRRRRVWLSLAAAVLLALAAGVVGTTLGMVRADQARVAEEGQRQIAEDKEREAEAQRRQAVEFRDRALDALRATTGEDVEQLIAAKPALGTDERAYLEAIVKPWQAFAAQEGDDEQSRALRGEGHLRVGNLLQKLGRRDQARGEYEQARVLFQELAAQSPAVTDYRHKLASTQSSFGDLLTDLGPTKEARVELEQARDILQKLAAQTPAPLGLQLDLARTQNNLGGLLGYLDKWEEARVEFGQARDAFEKLAAQFPAVPGYQQELARAHNNLGIVLSSLGKRDEARLEYEKSRDSFQKLAAQFPAVPRYKIELGRSYLNVGVLILEDAQPAESLPWLDRAVETLAAVREKAPQDAAARQNLRESYGHRARALGLLGRHEDSMKDWQKAADLGPKPETPDFRAARAASFARAGRVPEAVAEVAELTRAAKSSAEELYGFACVYAVASAGATDQKQQYAERAMELLRKAVQAGWKNAAYMAKDPDLDPLRARDDFKKLQAELSAKATADHR
jgi:tetratricopeptide (TPR) repeat protein